MAKKIEKENLKNVSGGIEYRHYERSGYGYIIDYRNTITGATDRIDNWYNNQEDATADRASDVARLTSYSDIEITYDSGVYGGKN